MPPIQFPISLMQAVAVKWNLPDTKLDKEGSFIGIPSDVAYQVNDWFEDVGRYLNP